MLSGKRNWRNGGSRGPEDLRDLKYSAEKNDGPFGIGGGVSGSSMESIKASYLSSILL